MLPEDGAALLAFKRNTEAPSDLQFGRAAVALDDPAARLAELEEFEDEPADESEQLAHVAANEASSALAAATTPAPELLPWFVEMERMLRPPWDEPDELPVRIDAHISLGDVDAAADVARLRALGISHVCNASNVHHSALEEQYHAAGIDYLLLNAEDDAVYDMQQHCDAAARFVQQARDAGGHCLVHCQAGINRSGFIVVAELMVNGGRLLLDALAHCSAQRGPLLWNEGFRVRLLNLAKAHGRLGDIPVDDPLPNAASNRPN